MSYRKQLEQSVTEAEQFILGKIEGRTFQIILNRPGQSNAFTVGMYVRLHLLFEDAGNDSNVDVVLVYANGKNFSSGNDLGNFTRMDFKDKNLVNEFADSQTDILKVMTGNLLNYTKPIICCCQGAIVGFIYPLLMLFDQIYLTEDAYFSAPMVKMQQSLEMYASYTFPRYFGWGKAFELLILGKRLTAKEAFEAKFVQKTFKTHEEMLKYATQTCKELELMNQKCIKDAKLLMKDPIRKQMWAANLEELKNLNSVWKDPKFPDKLTGYMKSINMKPKL